MAEKQIIKREKILPMFANKKEKTGKVIHALKWRTGAEINTLRLYDLLANNGIIPKDNETLENLKYAFSGDQLNKPLNIKWNLEYRNSIKPVLVRIIQYTLMDDLKLINKMENGDLARTLTCLFVDKEGKPIHNMIVTLAAKVSRNKPSNNRSGYNSTN